MPNPQGLVGGAFLPSADYALTGALTLSGAVAMSGGLTLTGTNTIGAGLTATSPALTTPTMTSPVVTGDAGTGLIFAKTVLFAENASSTTHTGTVVIPAGATLLDIIVVPQRFF